MVFANPTRKLRIGDSLPLPYLYDVPHAGHWKGSALPGDWLDDWPLFLEEKSPDGT